MLARDYQRTAQQEPENAVEEDNNEAHEIQSSDFPYEPVDAGLNVGLDFLESSANWNEFNPQQQGQSSLFPYLG